MSHDATEDNNSSANPTFDSIVSKRLSRRDVLGGATSAAALAAIGTTMAGTATAQEGYGSAGYGARNLRLGFDPVAKSLEDAVILPQGYSYDVLFALGDPI